MNKALLQQLALAKQAGTQSMAKDFFAKTPNPGTEPEAAPGADMQTSAAEPGAELPGAELPEVGGEPGAEEMTPEQLQELLAMLESQG